MEKSEATEKAIEAARAANKLLRLCSSDNEVLLEVIQDYFLLPEDDPVDDSEVDSDEEWRVADDLEGTYTKRLKRNHHNILIVTQHAETISSERQEDTASVDTNEDMAAKSMHTNERTTASHELHSLVNTDAQVPQAVRQLSTRANDTSVTILPTDERDEGEDDEDSPGVVNTDTCFRGFARSWDKQCLYCIVWLQTNKRNSW